MSDEATKQMAALGKVAGLKLVGDDDGQPVVLIAKDLNVTAKRLGEIVPRLDLFYMNGELVFFDHLGEMQTMIGAIFCTWINDHVLVAESYDKQGNPVPGMLGIDAASVVLKCRNFRLGVRPLKGVNHVRCPVIRPGKSPKDSLEALPWGYDAQTQIFTVPGGLEYAFDVPLEVAKGRYSREFSTFPITDDRSMAVQIAGMQALFVRHLPGGEGLRPGLLWYANKPGSGKSVLAKACLYPVMGRAAAAKMKKNEDLDKELEAFCRASVPFIFLDNIYGGIQSASIDQLLTSEESTGRAMGGHGVFTARNKALLLATGNQIDLNDDALRRFLLVDLFEKGDPEKREGFVPLNDSRMRSEEWRISMLESMWAVVAHWHEQGMPKGTVSLASFEEYALLLGGIVEAAGYSPPFTKALLPDAKSPGQAEFHELLALVIEELGTERTRDFTIENMARLARSAQLFQKDVGTQQDGKNEMIRRDGLSKDQRAMAEDLGYLTPAQNAAFGRRITKEIGTEPVVGGRRMLFGKRLQSRKATYTVEMLD